MHDGPPPPDEAERREALHVAVAGIEQALGPVVGLLEVMDGTAPGWRVRLDVAGRGPVFAKAADGTPWSEDAVGAEAALLTAVRNRHMPTVLAADHDGVIPWLVLSDLVEATWPPPWPADLRPVWRAIDRVAGTTPPGWLELAEDHDPWAAVDLAAARVDPDVAARLRAQAARVDLSGTDLVHGDLGAGNLVLVRDRVLLVDWSDAHVGNADLDRTTIALHVAHAEGRRVTPPVTDPAGWLAKVAGLLVGAAQRPARPGPGGAQVRAQQAALATTAIDWALAA